MQQLKKAQKSIDEAIKAQETATKERDGKNDDPMEALSKMRPNTPVFTSDFKRDDDIKDEKYEQKKKD